MYTLSLSYTADRLDYKIPIQTSTPTGYYVPTNNKCYCYPYNYLYVSNNSGNENYYKYEDFTYTVTEAGVVKLVFSIFASIGIGYSAKIVPNGYKNVSFNNTESIPLGKFPVCGWSSDSYTNWLTQNSINEGINIVKTGLNVANPTIQNITTKTQADSIGSGKFTPLSRLNKCS